MLSSFNVDLKFAQSPDVIIPEFRWCFRVGSVCQRVCSEILIAYFKAEVGNPFWIRRHHCRLGKRLIWQRLVVLVGVKSDEFGARAVVD